MLFIILQPGDFWPPDDYAGEFTVNFPEPAPEPKVDLGEKVEAVPEPKVDVGVKLEPVPEPKADLGETEDFYVL